MQSATLESMQEVVVSNLGGSKNWLLDEVDN
jgi:hypothetical protein